jgi:hypothetical protein
MRSKQDGMEATRPTVWADRGPAMAGEGGEVGERGGEGQPLQAADQAATRARRRRLRVKAAVRLGFGRTVGRVALRHHRSTLCQISECIRCLCSRSDGEGEP